MLMKFFISRTKIWFKNDITGNERQNVIVNKINPKNQLGGNVSAQKLRHWAKASKMNEPER